MFKCIIIDDEELARTLLQSYAIKLNTLEVVGSFENPLEALPLLSSQEIDIVFLDIQMPQIKGTDFAKSIPKNTKIIFTTAYSEYALEGFDLNATDYLLKPISFERFLIAIQKVKKHSNTTPSPVKETITVKSGYHLHKLALSDILYIKSDSEYVIFYLEDQKIMSYQSLKQLENTLPKSLFMRVHRSYIINKEKATVLKEKDLIINKERIPVSTTYMETVKKELFQ